MTITSMKTDYCGELRIKDLNRKVKLAGWVATVRDLGGIIFVELRDKSGYFQFVADPEKNPSVYTIIKNLKNEYTVQIEGIISERPSETYNPKLPTGEVEMYPEKITILSESSVLPFPLDDETVGEDLRLKYRYLDLRREKMLNNMILRHKVVTAVRNYLNAQSFIETETPVLINTTPEGARDYLVPSRVHEGKCYALPQSPQIFKQLLMVGGFEKYYQIAKCFRDEDLRADRQPEFTQIDIEMSFVEQDDIIDTVEGLAKEAFGVIDVKLPDKFDRITYKEAMNKYGSDKPDVRFGLELFDLGDIIEKSDFDAMKEILASGGIIKGIRIPGIAGYSRKELDDLRNLAVSYGAKGLANIIFAEDGTVKSPVLKFLKEGQIDEIKERSKAQPGDIIFFVGDKKRVTYDVMGRFRLYFGNRLNLIPENAHAILWVVDFPMFEFSEEEQRYMSVHHPFTMPNSDDLDKLESDPENCRSIAYDLVYNGTELGGGSVRIHKSDIQKTVFKALGLTPEDIQKKFGFLINAFQYGTPPHAGLAIGLDRLIALMAKTDSIRDVIAFPKNSAAKCLMTDAPAEVSEEQLSELHLRSTVKSRK